MNYLVTVDGDEFTGKTTVAIPALESYFSGLGYTVRKSREPGGSQRGEKMRKEIFEKLREGISPYEQAILFNEARKIHIDDIIKPFLESGDKKIMLLDRYVDATRVYQGYEGGVDMKKIFELEKKYVGSFFPNISVILYFPEDKIEELIQKRKSLKLSERKKNDEIVPFDEASLSTHILRNHFFLKTVELAQQRGEKRRMLSISVDGTPQDVSIRIIKAIESVLI